MSRRWRVCLAVMLALATVALGGCAAKMVRVETGTRVVCTYGETISDNVKVIEVPADKAAQYRLLTTTVTCDRHKHLEQLYDEAQAAIAAGQLQDAKAKLAEIVKADASFKKAQTQLTEIDGGKTPSSDAGTATPKPSGDGKQPVGPVANLSEWVPASLTGYSGAPIVADVYTLTREYTPAPGSPAVSLVVVVEQYKDAASAKRALSQQVAASYPASAATVQVKGRSVRFGTDGHRFATAAWNEGGVLIVVEASPRSGAPAALKSHLTAIVGQIAR